MPSFSQANSHQINKSAGRLLSCLGILLLLLLCLTAKAEAAPEQIELQLKWHHQFQFAGYYAAQVKGFYQQENLEVNLIEGGIGLPPVRQVLSGAAQYGIGDTDILVARVEGEPIVAIASIFQHSPYVLLSLRDRHINNPGDLIGKRIMLSDGQSAAQFRAVMYKEGIGIDKVEIVPHSWNLGDLINGRVDAISAYATVEPEQLRAMGHEPAILRSQDYGADFYGDTLFTTETEMAQHPERVAAFLRATKKGWAYAYANSYEIATLISQMSSVSQRGITQQMLLAEARDMAPYVLVDVVEPGHMNIGRWEHIAKTLAELGIISKNYDIKGFVYDPADRLESRLLPVIAYASACALALLGMVLMWNLQIRNKVRERTRALQAEIQRREDAESLLRIAGSTAKLGGWTLDVGSGKINWSDEVARIHDMLPGTVPNQEDGIRMFAPEYRPLIIAAVKACMHEGKPYDLELEKITAKGRRIWVRTIGQAVRDANGNITRLQGSFQDISLHKQAEKRIELLAFYDSMTRLPNRQLLLDRLGQRLTASARTHHTGAILFIDLDNFKMLNDTHGHDYGDLLLIEVAKRIVACVRESDTVSRLGGDEFVVIVDELDESMEVAAAQARIVCEKILNSFELPFTLNDYMYHSTATIGIALFNGFSQITVDELLRRADLAMYKAKDSGRNCYRFFDHHMQALISERMQIEEELRSAIAQQQLALYYQPQFDRERGIIGAEALLRWQHPERGLVMPIKFIALAEDSGLILPIGYWVLKTACEQLVKWGASKQTEHLTLSINVSARQCLQADFVEQVMHVIDSTGANPQKLMLELTESILLDNIEDIITKMSALKARGVVFSLDDFGTGYSSLSYLKQLPLEQLKIDRSFVRDVTINSDDASIVRTIISLGLTLDLEVLAEGVETEEQLQFLISEGCHVFQGYLFGKPVPVHDFDAVIHPGSVT